MLVRVGMKNEADGAPSYSSRGAAPESAEIELDRVERHGSDRGVASKRFDQQPSAALQHVGLERPNDGIDDPAEVHAGSGVERHLIGAIERRRRRRRHFADPVGRQFEPCSPGQLGHSFDASARPVRHQHVVAQMELGLEEDPPASGAAPTAVEGAVKLTAQHRRRDRMLRSRPRASYELAVHDFRDQMRRNGREIYVAGSMFGGDGYLRKSSTRRMHREYAAVERSAERRENVRFYRSGRPNQSGSRSWLAFPVTRARCTSLLQCFRDVLCHQIRTESQDLRRSHAVGNDVDDHRRWDPHAADAWSYAYLTYADGDTGEQHGGRGARATNVTSSSGSCSTYVLIGQPAGQPNPLFSVQGLCADELVEVHVGPEVSTYTRFIEAMSDARHRHTISRLT